jgi:hypothetical protein
VAAGPGAEAFDTASLADLPRLLAAAAGIDDHPWTDGPPAGVGVAQFDPPADPGDRSAIETVERWGLGDEALRRLTTPLTCAVAGELKVVQDGDRELVYDLTSDPLELDPRPAERLGTDRATDIEHLRAALRHPAVTARRDQASSAAAAGDPSAEELSDIEERMKLLGYM